MSRASSKGRYRTIEAARKAADRCSVCGAKQNMPHQITGHLVALKLWFIDADADNLSHSNVLHLCPRCFDFAASSRMRLLKVKEGVAHAQS